MASAEDIAARFESVFAAIRDTRMRDVPILNAAMPVKAVSFRAWGEYWLGVLITPWFMNLVLLPREGGGAACPAMRIGDSQIHDFPAGCHAFLLGEEEGLGRYQMCSLFSPMFQFEKAETAISTAEAVLVALFDAAGDANAGAEEKRVLAAVLSGEPVPPAQTPKAVSRRALITGFQAREGKDTP